MVLYGWVVSPGVFISPLEVIGGLMEVLYGRFLVVTHLKATHL